MSDIFVLPGRARILIVVLALGLGAMLVTSLAKQANHVSVQEVAQPHDRPPAAQGGGGPGMSAMGGMGGDAIGALMQQAAREPEPVIIFQPANYIENCTVTFYCVCKECCGKDPDHPDYGITASGRPAEPYVSVGVDPDVIPLGSTLTMDIGDGRGEQRYRADDTGSGVKGNHIDVCVGDHQTAEELGRRTASVVWAAPEEKGDA